MKKLFLILTFSLWLPTAHAGIADWRPENWFLEKTIDFVFLVIVTLTAAFLAYVIKGRHEINKFKYSREFEKGKQAFEKTDYLQAIQILKPLAEKGYAEAQLYLAVMYSEGLGALKNYDSAFEWYLKSSEQGNSDAQNTLGSMYRHGLGTEKNHKKAFEWTIESAQQGNANAQNNLATMYAEGIGVKKNNEEALKWLRNASNIGHTPSQSNLAYFYMNGIGVEKNYEMAVKLYRQAAKLGQEIAQYQLASLYINGWGVEKNYIFGYMWFTLAAVNGDSLAHDEIKKLQKIMPIGDIEKAKAMAKRCIESHYQKCPDEPEEERKNLFIKSLDV